MTLPILRDDALAPRQGGFSLRLSLPWIRSLPLSSLRDASVSIDGRAIPVRIRLGDRILPPDRLADESAWWFVQDRVVLDGDVDIAPGSHAVAVSFGLLVPYLPGSPGHPLILPFREERTLIAGAEASSVSRDAA